MAEKKTEAGKDEQIGFHKGSLTTLAKERQELMRMLTIVEQLMQVHIKELKTLGVDLEQQAKEIEKQKKSSSAPKKPIEDLLK